MSASLFFLVIFLIVTSRFNALEISGYSSTYTSVAGNRDRTYFDPFPKLCSVILFLTLLVIPQYSELSQQRRIYKK